MLPLSKRQQNRELNHHASKCRRVFGYRRIKPRGWLRYPNVVAVRWGV